MTLYLQILSRLPFWRKVIYFIIIIIGTLRERNCAPHYQQLGILLLRIISAHMEVLHYITYKCNLGPFPLAPIYLFHYNYYSWIMNARILCMFKTELSRDGA